MRLRNELAEAQLAVLTAQNDARDAEEAAQRVYAELHHEQAATEQVQR